MTHPTVKRQTRTVCGGHAVDYYVGEAWAGCVIETGPGRWWVKLGQTVDQVVENVPASPVGDKNEEAVFAIADAVGAAYGVTDDLRHWAGRPE